MKKPLFDDDEVFYVNEHGLAVLTEQFLLNRGYCCGNGCLHCPFAYKNVVDIKKREKLLLDKQKREDEKRSSLD